MRCPIRVLALLGNTLFFVAQIASADTPPIQKPASATPDAPVEAPSGVDIPATKIAPSKNVRDANEARRASEWRHTQGLQQVERSNDVREVPGADLSRSSQGREIPQRGSEPGKSSDGLRDVTGLPDPLNQAGARQQKPRSTVVGPGGIPSSGSLVSEPGERQNLPGELYKDDSRGVHHRSYSSEDGLTSTEEYQYPDGSRDVFKVVRDRGGEGYTEYYSHYGPADNRTPSLTGETRVAGPSNQRVPESRRNPSDIVPLGNTEKPPKPNAKTQPAEEHARGGSNCSPFTGKCYGDSKKTSGNRVNPGRDSNAGKPSGPRLQMDERKLVTNPDPNEARTQGAPPRQIDRNGGKIFAPPPVPK